MSNNNDSNDSGINFFSLEFRDRLRCMIVKSEALRRDWVELAKDMKPLFLSRKDFLLKQDHVVAIFKQGFTEDEQMIFITQFKEVTMKRVVLVLNGALVITMMEVVMGCPHLKKKEKMMVRFRALWALLDLSFHTVHP
jgi:hypothetical protein